jgi:predicted alpha/beta-hydrolase family hydrolase
MSVRLTASRATRPARILLVLAHGAGAGQAHPFMRLMATGLAARGIDVATFDFPYMAKGRKAPDRMPALLEAFRSAVTAARGRKGWERHRLIVGGKSMGGRVATHLATETVEALTGVVTLGYPLHPPGRPEAPRTAHLGDVRVPWLVVQGERDTFGTPAELRPVLKTLRRVTLHTVRDGDHSLKVRKSSGQDQDAVYAGVLDASAAWMTKVAG